MTCSLSDFSVCRNIIHVFLLLLLTVAVGRAQAITINFDDLNPEDFINAEGSDDWLFPLSNEYESVGLIFQDNAYLIGGGGNNFVNGPGFSFRFVGNLPTYVSMYVGSSVGYKVGVDAFGVNGDRDHKVTDGAIHGMTDEESTPYRDNQFVSFYMPEGISKIHLSGQGDAYIDNLYFGAEVPEPGSWILFCFGLLAIYLKRKTI